MKTALQVAAGVLLAFFVLFVLNIMIGVAPAAGEFFGAVVQDPGFWLLALILVAIAAGVYYLARRSRGPAR